MSFSVKEIANEPFEGKESGASFQPKDIFANNFDHIQSIIDDSKGDIKIDLHHYKSSEKHFSFLITEGMSTYVQSNEISTELILILDENIILSNDHWTVKLMRTAARFPLIKETYISSGHTLPNGKEQEPYNDEVGFTAILFSTINAKLGISEIVDPIGGITFLQIIPIYTAEREKAIKKGANSIVPRLINYGAFGPLNINRKNAGKSRIQLFK